MTVPANFNRELMLRASMDVDRFIVAAVEEIMQQIVRLTSRRGERAPGAPKDTGELRGSVRVTVGAVSEESPVKTAFYPIIGEDEVRAALASYQPGDVVWGRWIAKHAAIIEGGRRLSKRGFMIGSVQAPDGFLWIAIDEAWSIMARWKFGADDA